MNRSRGRKKRKRRKKRIGQSSRSIGSVHGRGRGTSSNSNSSSNQRVVNDHDEKIVRVRKILEKSQNNNGSSKARKSFVDSTLGYLNGIRKKYGVPSLKWNNGLYNLAKKNINNGLSGDFKDTISKNSLTWFDGSLTEGKTLFDSIKKWYKSHENYDYEKPYGNDFSKMVWKSTTDVGIFIESSGGKQKILAYFFPKGEYGEENHRENVRREVHNSDPFLEEKEREEKLKEEKEKKMYPGIPQVDRAWKDMTLKIHSDCRKKHGCPPLKWSDRAYRFATHWSRTLARERGFYHSKHSNFGENLFTSTGRIGAKGENGFKESLLDACRDAIESWYNEIEDYDFHDHGFGFGTGHFTQVIWKNTKFVGMGYSINGSTIVVSANYSPHGNFMGKFKENVPPLIDRSYEVSRDGDIEESKEERKKRMRVQKTLRRNQRITEYYLRLKNDQRMNKSISPASQNWISSVLKHANRYRKIHGSPPLKWCHSLYAKAKLHCNKGEMKFIGVNGNQLSEIVLGVFGSFKDETPKLAKYCMDSFYENVKYHDFEKHIGGDQFMNLVARRSKFIGMASFGNGRVVNCLLYPPLCSGDEKKNVFRKGTRVKKYQEVTPLSRKQKMMDEIYGGRKVNKKKIVPSSENKMSFDELLKMSYNNNDNKVQELEEEEEEVEGEEEEEEEEENVIQSFKISDLDRKKKPFFPSLNERKSSFRNNVAKKKEEEDDDDVNKENIKRLLHRNQTNTNKKRRIRKTKVRSRQQQQQQQQRRIRKNGEVSETKIYSFLEPESIPKYESQSSKFEKLKALWTKKCVLLHNKIRRQHSAPPIIWSEDLCQHAVEWSFRLAEDNTLNLSKNRQHKNLGENIFFYKVGEKVKLPHSELFVKKPGSGKRTVAASTTTTTRRIRNRRPRRNFGLNRRKKKKGTVNAFPKFYDDLIEHVLVKNWYENELKNYSFKEHGNRLDTMHFSQLVWKSTALLGMGFAINRVERIVVVVANYTPSGNITGEFRKEVFPKLDPSVIEKLEKEEKEKRRKQMIRMKKKRRMMMKKKRMERLLGYNNNSSSTTGRKRR